MINKDFCSKWAGEANGAARGPENNRTEILSPANEQYKGRRAAVPDGSNGPSGVPEVPSGFNGFRGMTDKERVEALVAAIEAAQQDIAPSYNDWFSAGVALASALGEEGRTYFHRISRFYAGYNYHECDKKYNDCLRDPNPAYTLGTLFHLAKQAGIQVAQSEAKQEPYTPPYHAAAAQSEAKQETYTPPYHAAAAQSQAPYAAPFPASANTASAENTMPKNKSKKQNRIATIIDFFNRKFHNFEDLRHDVLSGKIQYRKRDAFDNLEDSWYDVTDHVICSITCDINVETGLSITTNEVHTVLKSDRVKSVNPLQDWLNNLPQYEPQEALSPYIDALASQVHVKASEGSEEAQERWTRWFRKWFVGMVAGWLDHTHPNHQVLVLISEKQGIFKTSWLEHLMPPALSAYRCKQASVREVTTDDRMRITEFGLINLDEIDSMSPRELNVLKSVITTDKVNERAPYARTKDERPRYASFCGSGNNKRFLTDDTGNRRWLPFEVESIDNPWERQEPYEMIFAEAKYLAESGTFQYYFDQDDIQNMNSYTDDFCMQTPEEELLNIYFQPAQKGDAGAIFLSAAEMLRTLIDAGRITRPMPINKFGVLLKKKGFNKYVLARGKKGYLVIEHKSIEITERQKEEAKEVQNSMPNLPQETVPEASKNAEIGINDADSTFFDNCLQF
ncbi:MAG: PriCT-2 domain-containing protein [Bacteroidales bacterium]|nr:PriCT-2 domain-containing protein [Bacteroidales bacterium]